MIPVRCYTCNYTIATRYDAYVTALKDNIPPDIIFKQLKIRRYCCKRMLISHVSVDDDT